MGADTYPLGRAREHYGYPAYRRGGSGSLDRMRVARRSESTARADVLESVRWTAGRPRLDTSRGVSKLDTSEKHPLASHGFYYSFSEMLRVTVSA